MADSKKLDIFENGEASDLVDVDQDDGREMQGSSSQPVGGGVAYEVSGAADSVGLADRLTDIFVDQGDGDLLLTQNYGENKLLQWFQASDLHVPGACRADERLKPLLKFNVSSVAAEDRLLSHLNQHFEASEVGVLARCLCIPLVSIRVGKIVKQGTVLCPTTTRGNLNLILLPTSDLRISFIGDDGSSERLVTLHSLAQRCAVRIEHILADTSGRSFLLKITDTQTFYFWCSEYSKLLGNELLSKMRGVLERTPSLAVLTGICESRLSCFAAHLRSYLISTTSSSDASMDAAFEVPQSLSAVSTNIPVDPFPPNHPTPPAKEESPMSAVEKPKPRIHISLIDMHPVVSAASAGGFMGAPPYYCWCPPQYSALPLQQMLSSSSELAPLPGLLSPLVSKPFKPLMCESIIHVPVMDLCSSGQAYLVSSSGPSSGLGSGSMGGGAESVEEKGARETLRLLLSSSNQMDGVFVTGTRGVYEGSNDVGVVPRSCAEQMESGNNDGELGLKEENGCEGIDPSCSSENHDASFF